MLDQQDEIDLDPPTWEFTNKTIKFEKFETLSDDLNSKALDLLNKNNDLFACSFQDLVRPCTVAKHSI